MIILQRRSTHEWTQKKNKQIGFTQVLVVVVLIVVGSGCHHEGGNHDVIMSSCHHVITCHHNGGCPDPNEDGGAQCLPLSSSLDTGALQNKEVPVDHDTLKEFIHSGLYIFVTYFRHILDTLSTYS